MYVFENKEVVLKDVNCFFTGLKKYIIMISITCQFVFNQ